MERNGIELAEKILAPVIDPALPVGEELAAIADYDTAKQGEFVYKYTSEDTTGDVLLTIDGDGTVTPVKRSPKAPTLVSFTGYQTPLDYVLIEEILPTPDQATLARRKDSHVRALDKKELKNAIDLILSASAQEVVQGSADDIYMVIEAMIAKVEAYGTDGVLLVGTDVFRAIRKYDRANVDTFHYKVSIKELLSDSGIELMKIAQEATVSIDGGSQTAVLAADKAVLVMRNSKINEGKPLSFVRRQIDAATAAKMGIEIDNAYRASAVQQMPVPKGDGSIVAGYGIWMYESVVTVLKSSRLVCFAVIS